MNERIFDSRLAERIAGDDTARRDRLKAVARMLVGVVRDGLVRDGVVRIHGFGTFQLRPTKPRRGINPQTGERILIPARHRVIFRPAKALRERVDPDPGHAVPLDEPRASREAMLAGIASPAAAAGALPVSGIRPAERPQERPAERPAMAAAIPQAVESSSNARTPATAPAGEPAIRPIADAESDTAGSAQTLTPGDAANESVPGGRPQPPDERPRRKGALLALLLLAFVAVLAWLLWPVAREPTPPVAEEPAESVTVPEVAEPAAEPPAEVPTDPDAVAPDIASVPVETAPTEAEMATPPGETAPVETAPPEAPAIAITGPLAESHPQFFAGEPTLDPPVTVAPERLDATVADLAPTLADDAPTGGTPAEQPADMASAPIDTAMDTTPVTPGEAPADPRPLDAQVAALGGDLGAEFDPATAAEPVPMDPVASDPALPDAPLTTAEAAPAVDDAVAAETVPAPDVTPAEAAERAIAEPTDPTAATAAQPWFAAREYTVRPGDTLWGLAEGNYINPYFWPHIFNHNASTVIDPDRIAVDQGLLLPALQGDPAALTDADRTSIAEGYLRLYRFWEADGRANADYALVGVRFFDAGVLPAGLAGAGQPADALSAAFHAQLSAHYGR